MKPKANQNIISAKPMNCPECEAEVSFRDLRTGRCPKCRTKIVVSRGFVRKVWLAALPVNAMIFVLGFFVIPYRLDWSGSAFAVMAAAWVVGFIWTCLVRFMASWLSPPRIERDIGDPIRLDLS
jgi:uncharacterized paraquat-inducible protein A